jgi:polygalacturonase
MANNPAVRRAGAVLVPNANKLRRGPDVVSTRSVAFKAQPQQESGVVAPPGTITSVNGQIGPAVVLTAADVGADAAGSAAAAQAAAATDATTKANAAQAAAIAASLQKAANLSDVASKITSKANLNIIEVNVLDYGADRTGATDSSTALAAAIAALPATYGHLHFPPGVYRSDSGIILANLSHLLVTGPGTLFAEVPAFTLSSLTNVGTTATGTTSAPHGFSTGWSVSVRQADQAPYNGTWTITVTGASTFTYVMGSDPGATATTSTTLKVQKNIQLLQVQETCEYVTLEGLNLDGDATIRGDGIHCRFDASNSKIVNCSISNASGFGLFIGGSRTTYLTNVLVDGCSFVDTMADGLHFGGVNGGEVTGCLFDNTGDDCIGIIGYEGYADLVLNINVNACVFRNMHNTGLGSASGCRINLSHNVQIEGCTFDDIDGPAVRVSDGGTSHTTVYNRNLRIAGIVARDCTYGVEGYWLENAVIEGVQAYGCPAVVSASWKGILVVRNCHTYSTGANAITFYVGPQTSFSGRNFDANWGSLIIKGLTGSSDISDGANCVVYMDTHASFDIANLVINGCSGVLTNPSAWIVYKGIAAGGAGKVTNNTNIGNTTITNAGGTAATLTNNN